MLRPEPMKRVLVISSKESEDTIIRELHQMGAVHIIEYKEGQREGFRIGKTLAASSAASERLVRLRSLARQLGIVAGTAPRRVYAAKGIETRLSAGLAEMESNANSAIESRDRIAAALTELSDEETRLRPFAQLPLVIEDYRGYDTIDTFVGTAAAGWRDGLARASKDAIAFGGDDGVVAVFVPKDQSQATMDQLTKHGFKAVELPSGKGSPAARMEAIQSERRLLEERLEKSRGEVANLRAQWTDFILAAEEHLSIETEKGEAPLAFATTENAFVVDAWVPATQFHWVASRLNQATNGSVHVEVVTEAHHEHEALGHGHSPDEAAREEPPTKYKNPGAARPFEFFIDLFSKPKHDEIDPTVVVAVVFPVFFGFMIGDLGYGILMMLIGYTLLTKLKSIEGIPSLGTAILAAGVVASIFGGVFFVEAFGIPFAASHHAIEELGHEGLAATCANVQTHLKETTWTCIASGGAETGVMEPVLGKLTNVTDLLVLSLLAGFVHIFIGLAFGLVNSLGHGWKHLGAKVGWLFVLFAFLGLMMGMATPLITHGTFLEPAVAALSVLSAVTLFLLVPGFVLLVATEGPIGALEILGLLSNMISYTRLAGVAVAKGAMAFAFNGLFLVGMVMDPNAGLLLVVVGLLLLIVTQLMVFVLGILSSGIQAIRLNYVEFFLKFFAGGGKSFAPFGRKRIYSTA
ncbi:MAG: V-type ATP synthase subunit I [Euryarchaeota archaeon]|nr:V-type ATP synthase subunit I [Euryarchaeota archaeon]